MKFVALIPVRGGSKGIPRKNLLKLEGKSLLEWTVIAARESGEFSRIIVSTDDREIAEVARSLAVEVAYPRPAELSNDTSLQYDVIKYEMSKLIELDKSLTHYMLLQVTCPLRNSKDIQNALMIFKQQKFRSLISVMNADQYHPSTLYSVIHSNNSLINMAKDFQHDSERSKGTLRQELSKVMWRNGAIYVGSLVDLKYTNTLLNSPIGYYEMPWHRSINIDSWENVKQAELLLKNKLQEENP